MGNVIIRGMNRRGVEGVTLGYGYFKEDWKGKVGEGELGLKLSALETFGLNFCDSNF